MAIHRPKSAAMDCRATLAMTSVNDWYFVIFCLPKTVTGGTRGIARAIVTVALKFSVSQARALAAYWPN